MTIKLNLGSGKTRLKGYLNVDILDIPGIDVKHDLNKPLPYKDGEVDAIYVSHIIEHFWWTDTLRILEDWYRALKKGGSLTIWTVDFERVVMRLISSKDYIYMMGDVNWRLYSKKEPENNAHHAVFTSRYLCTLLKSAGFSKIGIIDPEKYEFKPLHDGINMGVIAVK